MVSLGQPRVFFSRASFHLFGLQCVQVLGVVPSQVQDLVELHEIPVNPFLKLIEVPLDDNTISWSMNTVLYHLGTC